MTTPATDTVQSETEELERLKKLVHVPGLWKCAKCNFFLIQSNLNANDGTITARDNPGDKCPNCDTPLWRVSEREHRIELQTDLEKQWHRAQAAEAELTRAREREKEALWIVGQLLAGLDNKSLSIEYGDEVWENIIRRARALAGGKP